MTLEQLEAAVLALPKESQILLLARLFEHLGQSNNLDPDIAADWLEEALKRDRSLEDGEVTGIPAAQVFEQLRASLK
ncbi:MAG: addiction module protein [Chloroflexaceae bacterium]|nr:addiction module protein [Chloroflexaceae bacterium]